MRHGRLLLAACAALALAATVRAQAPVKPGPEHEMLKDLEGTWDATTKFGGMESKGTMTYKMALGGLYLLSDFQGEFGGEKFTGHGIDGYDPAKKKYIGVWVDSMSPAPMVSEGTYDKDSHTMTMTGKGAGPDGKPVNYKMVSTMKDKDSMVFTMSSVDKDGKEMEAMTITYKRKK